MFKGYFDGKRTNLKLCRFYKKTEHITVGESFTGGLSTIFRGQPIEGKLIPSIARQPSCYDTTIKERGLLEQLRLMGAALLPDPKSEDIDLLVLAQHFGMTTRLLDWTSNPLAALWFACSGKINIEAEYIYVYALNIDGLLNKDLYNGNYDPFVSSADGNFEPVVFQPRLNNLRIIAQHGWFTLHQYSTEVKGFVPLENNPKINIIELRIPVTSCDQILIALDRHGINNRTLFPDLQGLCSHLNWKYKDSWFV